MRIKDKPAFFRDLILAIIIAIIALLAFGSKLEASCPRPVIDTIQGGRCKFIALNPVPVAGDIVNACFLFKPETPAINMQYLLVQSTSCGPNVYTVLRFWIYSGTNCDTLYQNGQIYPTFSNTFVQGLDTSRYYSLCLQWRASCQQDSICARYVPSPLPVELTSFSVELDETVANLSWTTASEINNDYFELEKADSSFEFKHLTKIAGNGNSTRPILYHYLDKNPYKGINYYKLKQYDYDGSITVYDPIVVYFDPKYTTFNPFIIYNLLGQKIK